MEAAIYCVCIVCVHVFSCVHKSIFCTRNDEKIYISTCFVFISECFKCWCVCVCVCACVCVQLFCVDKSTDDLLKCQQTQKEKSNLVSSLPEHHSITLCPYIVHGIHVTVCYFHQYCSTLFRPAGVALKKLKLSGYSPSFVQV